MKHKDIYILSELFPNFFNNRDVPEDWDEDDLLIDFFNNYTTRNNNYKVTKAFF